MDLKYQQYQNQFSGTKREKALERAWKNRDFEIELYWKRATYFWTFLVATFAGYFVVISRQEVVAVFPQAEYIVICLGLTFSLAWYLANKGSKKWQENWERHIDLLEQEVTGNLYKTVLDKTGYSVSGINKLVSLFIVIIWILMGIRFLITQKTYIGSLENIDWITSIATTVTIIFSILLYREKKDAPKENKFPEISFSLREFIYVDPVSKKIKKTHKNNKKKK
ncbi:MAG: hypothetical protein ACK4ND_05815 [Cytophagaceae bacterium]